MVMTTMFLAGHGVFILFCFVLLNGLNSYNTNGLNKVLGLGVMGNQNHTFVLS